MKQQNEKQRVNKSSILLSQDENDLVFHLLGPRCQVWALCSSFNCENIKNNSIFTINRVDNEHGSGSIVYDRCTSPFCMAQTIEWNCMFRKRQLQALVFHSSLLYDQT